MESSSIYHFLLVNWKNQVNRCYGKSGVKVVAQLVGGSTLYPPPVQEDGVIVNIPLLTGKLEKPS